MKDLNININKEIPKGYIIDVENSNLAEGNIVLKKKETKLPTTNKECVSFLPKQCFYINSEGTIDIIENTKKDPNTITTKEYAEAFLALMQLIKFRDIWNEGWLADWTDNTWKYTIYFYKKRKKARVGPSGGGDRTLSFKSEKVRDKFSETFDELIHIAKPLL